jgi:hypothetical protein
MDAARIVLYLAAWHGGSKLAAAAKAITQAAKNTAKKVLKFKLNPAVPSVPQGMNKIDQANLKWQEETLAKARKRDFVFTPDQHYQRIYNGKADAQIQQAWDHAAHARAAATPPPEPKPVPARYDRRPPEQIEADIRATPQGKQLSQEQLADAVRSARYTPLNPEDLEAYTRAKHQWYRDRNSSYLAPSYNGLHNPVKLTQNSKRQTAFYRVQSPTNPKPNININPKQQSLARRSQQSMTNNGITPQSAPNLSAEHLVHETNHAAEFSQADPWSIDAFPGADRGKNVMGGYATKPAERDQARRALQQGYYQVHGKRITSGEEGYKFFKRIGVFTPHNARADAAFNHNISRYPMGTQRALGYAREGSLKASPKDIREFFTILPAYATVAGVTAIPAALKDQFSGNSTTEPQIQGA